jgi:hypothetical protein
MLSLEMMKVFVMSFLSGNTIFSHMVFLKAPISIDSLPTKVIILKLLMSLHSSDESARLSVSI